MSTSEVTRKGSWTSSLTAESPDPLNQARALIQQEASSRLVHDYIKLKYENEALVAKQRDCEESIVKFADLFERQTQSLGVTQRRVNALVERVNEKDVQVQKLRACVSSMSASAVIEEQGKQSASLDPTPGVQKTESTVNNIDIEGFVRQIGELLLEHKGEIEATARAVFSLEDRINVIAKTRNGEAVFPHH